MSSYVKVSSNYDFQTEREVISKSKKFKKERIKESKLSAKT